MLVQTNLFSIIGKCKLKDFISDMIYLQTEWQFRAVFKSADNQILILASPYCSFYLFVDVEKAEISYIDKEILELLCIRISHDLFREFYENFVQS